MKNQKQIHTDNALRYLAGEQTQPQPDKATARPWRVSTFNDYSGIAIETDRSRVDDRETICTMEFDDSVADYSDKKTESARRADSWNNDDHDETKANAALIVKAVNEHAALLECEKTLACVFENAKMMNAAEPSRVWSAIETGAGETLSRLAAVRSR